MSRVDPFMRALRRIAADTPPIKLAEYELSLRRLFSLGIEEGLAQADKSVARLKEEVIKMRRDKNG